MASSSRGRVVLLTGAAGGIGRAMTDALLAAGHSVAAVDRDQIALEKLTARHDGAKDRLHPIVADLGSEAGCQSAATTARTRFGAIEAVINNAGIGMSSIRPDAEAARSRHRGADAANLGRLHGDLRARAGHAAARGVAGHETRRLRPHRQ